MFYIYHIPGVKIGCSTQPKKRVEKQGYSSYEILEEHSCIDSASKRELELQKEYGYKLDTSPYWLSVQNRRKWSDEDRKKSQQTLKRNGFFNDWYKKGNRARMKGVVMLDKETYQPIKEFKCIADAARYLNKKGNTSVISACCRGIKSSIYGYKWKYKD